MERAFEVISTDEPDEDLAMLAAQLSRSYWFSGDLERAASRAELALDIAEQHGYPKPLSTALRAKSAVLESRRHSAEAFALLKHSLEVALENDLAEDASTCYFILSDRCFRLDRYADALEYLDEGLKFDRKVGNRRYEWASVAERCYPLLMLGRWDEVLETRESFTDDQFHSGGVVLSLLQAGVEIYGRRGDLDEARRLFSAFEHLGESSDVQDRSAYFAVEGALRRAEGRHEEALEAGMATIPTADVLGPAFQGVKHGVVDALEAALALGDAARAEELLGFVEALPPGQPAAVPRRAGVCASGRRLSGEAAGLRPRPLVSARSPCRSGSRSPCSSTPRRWTAVPRRIGSSPRPARSSSGWEPCRGWSGRASRRR